MAEKRAPAVPVRFYRTPAGAGRHGIGLDLMRVQFGWPIGMPLCRV